MKRIPPHKKLSRNVIRRSDEVPAKLCNETALQPLVNSYLTRAHSDIN